MSEVESLRQEMNARFEEQDRRFALGDQRFDTIMKCHNETCVKIDTLVKNTDPIVKFLTDAQATGRMANRMYDICWFLVKWGAIWGGIIAGFVAVREFFFGN
jgi:hypothetical protein